MDLGIPFSAELADSFTRTSFREYPLFREVLYFDKWKWGPFLDVLVS